MDLHADDCVFVAHAAGSVPAEGKEAVRDAFAGYIALLPDINFAERALHVGEGFWVLESSMTGTVEHAIEVEGESLGTRSTGRGRLCRCDRGPRWPGREQADLSGLERAAAPARRRVMTPSPAAAIENVEPADAAGRSEAAAAWVAMFADGLGQPGRRRQLLRPLRSLAPRRGADDPALDAARGRQAGLPRGVRAAALRSRAGPAWDCRGLVRDRRRGLHRAAARGDGRQAKFTMHTCDRVKIRDERAVERFAYLDATPLIKAVLASPRSWPTFIRSQLRSLRRTT